MALLDPRDTENILVYTGKILPVTTVVKSTFLVSIYYVIKQHYTHCACVHLMRASSIHFQDGGSPTFIEVGRWCLSRLFCGEQLVVH